MADPTKIKKIERILLDEIFFDEYGRPKKIPLYVAQLQVLLENSAFDWQVTEALRNLANEGTLQKTEQITQNASSVLFYFPKQIVTDASSDALVKKHIFSIAKLIDSYSVQPVTYVVGKHLEALVKYELRVQRFKNIQPNSRRYKDKEWTRTGHNLDFIAEHESANFAVGVEVKNTLGVPDRSKVEVKIDICKYLGIIPVFAVRWIGQHYKLVTNADGYPWIFKTQMYPLGFEELTKEMYQRLSLNSDSDKNKFKYEMPISVRTELPPRPVEKFEEWVKSKI